jgi:hypothetical protein
VLFVLGSVGLHIFQQSFAFDLVAGKGRHGHGQKEDGGKSRFAYGSPRGHCNQTEDGGSPVCCCRVRANFRFATTFTINDVRG